MKQRTIKQWHKLCWHYMSLIVRIRAIDKRTGFAVCFTCGVRKPYKELECGHFRHNKLDFELLNNHAQCAQCNKFKHGNLGTYATALVNKYGKDVFDLLDAKEAIEHKQHKMTILDYEELLKQLKAMLAEVKKEKEL